MSLWWLQPEWTQTKCSCGATIWPEGDPDMGVCYSCFQREWHEREEQERYYDEMRRAEEKREDR